MLLLQTPGASAIQRMETKAADTNIAVGETSSSAGKGVLGESVVIAASMATTKRAATGIPQVSVALCRLMAREWSQW
jgi:hypothetical protein